MAQKTDAAYKNKGIALIFIHTTFDSADADCRIETEDYLIEKKLLTLKFEVKSYTDRTCQQIKDILQETGNLDHSDNECLVVVVVSRGSNEEVYAKDKTYPVACLWENFLDCKSLIGKPKLFFIQASRLFEYASFTSDQLYASLNVPKNSDMLVMYRNFEYCESWSNDGSTRRAIDVIGEKYKDGTYMDLFTLISSVIGGSTAEFLLAYKKH